MPEVDRDLGRMEARQDGADRRLDEYQANLQRIESKIDGLIRQFENMSGSKKMLFTMLTTSAAISGAVIEFLRWLHFWPATR